MENYDDCSIVSRFIPSIQWQRKKNEIFKLTKVSKIDEKIYLEFYICAPLMRVLALRSTLWFYFNFISMCVSFFRVAYLSHSGVKTKIGAGPVASLGMQLTSPLLVWFIFFT